jgi:hypothetical protein
VTGGPIFEPALKSLAHRGRQLEITSVGDRRVSFDLLDFYHNESRLFGVDTRHHDAIALQALLEALMPMFEQGAFKAPKIDRIIPLSEGRTAYEQVARGEARGGWSWHREVARATQKGIRTKSLKLMDCSPGKQVIAGRRKRIGNNFGIGTAPERTRGEYRFMMCSFRGLVSEPIAR